MTHKLDGYKQGAPLHGYKGYTAWDANEDSEIEMRILKLK